MTDRASVGVIGGSGLYSLFDEPREVVVPTPYGPTAAPVTLGMLGGRPAAFLPRHGTGHSFAPQQIPYRANVWALASLGVTALITSSAVGGLRADLAPGTFVVPDQVIDATWGRDGTFFDGDRVEHLPAADPFDPALRSLATAALAAVRVPVEGSGTAVVIPGPRFSTRAESRRWASLGGDIVNMTMSPEVFLARELGLGVVNLAFVTDSDAAVDAGHADAVDGAKVLERLRAAQPVIRAAIAAIAGGIPADWAPAVLLPADAIAAVLALTPR